MAKDKKKTNTGKTVAGIKLPKKKTVVRRVHLEDEKYTGTEPQWDATRIADMSDSEFDIHLRRSLSYYNYHFTVKDLKPALVKWLYDQKEFEFSKEDLALIIKSSWVPMTACSLIAAHNRGMPLKINAIQYLEKSIRDVCAKYDESTDEEATEAKPAVKIPNIQDRMAEKTAEVIGELEGHYDSMSTSKIKIYEFLTAQNVPQAQLGKIERVYLNRRAEIELARKGSDEQLAEGYSHFKAADFKRHIGWIDDLLQGIKQYAGVKRATKKARIKKSPSKEKLVAKLKYLKIFAPLKLVSISPVDIIGSTDLWVFNTKTRKLGVYRADSLEGPLNVKGTTIVGFDTSKSVAKTLRRPEEQLKDFAKAGKVALRKFLDDIKATETLLTGRINEDIILLKTQ